MLLTNHARERIINVFQKAEDIREYTQPFWIFLREQKKLRSVIGLLYSPIKENPLCALGLSVGSSILQRLSKRLKTPKKPTSAYSGG